MDFALSEEQRSIRDTIQKFVAKECERESIKKMDEEKIFPADLFGKVADIGLCALTVPEAYGGAGPNTLGAVIVTAELAAIYPALAGIFANQSLCGGKVISDLGTEEQKNKYLPGVIDGSALITIGLAEPEQGYEEAGKKTIARPDGQNMVLDGIKTMVRLADRSSFMITRVAVGNADGVSAFMVIDMKSPGINVRSMEQIGFHGMNLCEVSLNAVVVEAGERLGGDADEAAQQKQWKSFMSAEHLAVAACGTGLARGAYEYALNYAKERSQFGRPIIKFGAVQEMLVDMAQQTRIAELLTCQAAYLVDQGNDCLAEIIQARLAATEAARKVSLYGVQIFGGYGYAMEYDAQRYLRDAMVMFSGGETKQVMSNKLASLWDY